MTVIVAEAVAASEMVIATAESTETIYVSAAIPVPVSRIPGARNPVSAILSIVVLVLVSPPNVPYPG